MAANTSNGNRIMMVKPNAKSTRSMSIDPSKFKEIAIAVVDAVNMDEWDELNKNNESVKDSFIYHIFN